MGRFVYFMVVTAALILFLLFAFARGVFVSSDRVVRGLAVQGFSEVEITDKDILALGFRGCSSGDAAKYEFTAINPAGVRVSAIACIGLFKGVTVRSD
ncbi:MAG: hypothetical protein KAJ19_13405 [Gammaproteobacteria bacterium]|nr:hypothetical protein [Gammaproteobacteria bacterium]